MNAEEWKAKGRAASETVDLALPSGMVIKARRPGPLQFAQWDKLPLLLVGVAGAGPAGAEAMTVDRAKAIAEFMRELLCFCCVEPRVPEDIHPREIPEADWTFIVGWAMRTREAESLRPFRGERKDVGGDCGGEAVFVETQRTAGDRGPGDGSGVRPGGRGKSGGRARVVFGK